MMKEIYTCLWSRDHRHVNGKQENIWGRVEGRLLAMLEGEPNLTLEQLNLATQDLDHPRIPPHRAQRVRANAA
jgi:hypothetical protein